MRDERMEALIDRASRDRAAGRPVPKAVQRQITEYVRGREAAALADGTAERLLTSIMADVRTFRARGRASR